MEESTGRRNEGERYVEIGGGRARGMQNRGANLAPHQREREERSRLGISRPADRPPDRRHRSLPLHAFPRPRKGKNRRE